MADGGREETAYVSGQDGFSTELCASRQEGSLNSQTESCCPSFAEGWKGVRHLFLSGLGKTQPAGGRFFFGLGGLNPEVFVAGEGQTIRPVKSEGVARGLKSILEAWRMAKINANSERGLRE